MNIDDTIFIAGAKGVAGSAIKHQLKEKGFRHILAPSFQELDLSDWNQVSEFFSQERPMYVFLVAAKMGSILYRNSHPAELLLNNLLIQNNVIRASHDYRVKKLLFMSSDFIYPSIDNKRFEESDFLTGLPSAQDFPYSLAKITGVKLCDYYREEYHDQFFTIVPCAFFGPNSTFELEKANVVPALIHRMHDAKMRKDKEFILWGSGKPIKEFLFSEDVASACLLLMEQKLQKGLYNVGSSSGGISILKLAEIVKSVVGFSGKIVCDTTKPDGALYRVPDSSAIRLLGWKPQYSLKTAIKLMYEQFLIGKVE